MAEAAYLAKAIESLEGALAEYANRRYQTSANRSYYACFQAAIHAVLAARLTPPPGGRTWSHGRLQAEFINQLIERRKLYPSELRSVLSVNYTLREAADYSDDLVSGAQAERALRRARNFVDTVQREESRG